jgi:hypothetical protein
MHPRGRHAACLQDVRFARQVKRMTRLLYVVYIARALFLCLLAACAAFAYYVFGVSCIIFSFSGACGEHPILVGAATIAFSLPAALILAIGWWRVEATNENISANRDDDLRLFRLIMAVSLALCIVMMSASDMLRAISIPMLAATVLTWIIVELTRALANAVRPDKSIAT